MTKDFHKLFITMRSDSTRRLDAWKLFITLNPKNFYIRNVLQSISELRVIAWEELELRKPNKSDLRFIIKNIPELQIKAGKYWIRQNPTIEDLVTILSFVPSLLDEAIAIFEKEAKKITTRQLRLIIRWVPGMRERAGQLLITSRRLNNEDIRRIIRYIPSMRSMAYEKFRIMQPKELDNRYIKQFIKDNSI